MTVLDIIKDHIDAHGLTADSTVAIVREYLEGNEYDGLSSDECGCRADDLCPCGESCSDCVPGRLVKCANCSLSARSDDPDAEHCPHEPTADGWCIFAFEEAAT